LKSDSQFNFIPFLEGLQKELLSLGFEMEVSQKSKSTETSVVSAFMKANTLKLYLSIGEDVKTQRLDPSEKIHIKLEVDTDPPSYGFQVEDRLVLNPTPFYVSTLHSSELFGGKLHALLYRSWKGRVKGRDWYDLIWYIQNQIPVNLRYLEACMRQTGSLKVEGHLTKQDLIELLQDKIQKIDWESAKADVRPFIVEPERLDIWSAAFFSELIQSLLVT
jgi:hypothetical protein